jgi:prophage regulatory protein
MSRTPKTKQTPVAASIPAQAQMPAAASPSFDALPSSAFIRESQLVQSPKRPDSPAPLPFSAPTLWRKVKDGTFPKPHKLSRRVTAWKVADVRQWIDQQTAAV